MTLQRFPWKEDDATAGSDGRWFGAAMKGTKL
jgi:hypothetical protein